MTSYIPEHIKAELRAMDTRRDCSICMDIIPRGEVEVTDCGHYFCRGCLKGISVCPNCRNKSSRGKTVVTRITVTTTDMEGRYEAVDNEVYFIKPNGDCYELDPIHFSMPHKFVGRISNDRKFVQKGTREQ